MSIYVLYVVRFRLHLNLAVTRAVSTLGQFCGIFAGHNVTGADSLRVLGFVLPFLVLTVAQFPL